MIKLKHEHCIEADNFAIELLMPSEKVEKIISDMSDNGFLDKNIENVLSREFNVDIDTVEKKLKIMGIK